jgi:hypothetical protein
MPKRREEGAAPKKRKSSTSLRTRLLREYRVKLKEARKHLREIERDYNSLKGRRKNNV